MQLLFLISTLIQIYCAVHAIRNGYGYQWVMIILLFPILGSVVYLCVEMWPKTRVPFERWLKRKRAQKVSCPHKRIADLKEQISNMPNIDLQRELAMLYLELAYYGEALTLINQLLRKPFDNDPILLVDKAEIYYKLKEYRKAKEILLFLMNEDPYNTLCYRGKQLYHQTLIALDSTHQ
jgi:hypothetical protein